MRPPDALTPRPATSDGEGVRTFAASRAAVVVAIGAGWLAWLPFAYAGIVYSGNWTVYAAPVAIGGAIALLASLVWLRADTNRWISWLALWFTVVSVGATGWSGGERLGGVVLAVVGVVPALVISWGFFRLGATGGRRAPDVVRGPSAVSLRGAREPR